MITKNNGVHDVILSHENSKTMMIFQFNCFQTIASTVTANTSQFENASECGNDKKIAIDIKQDMKIVFQQVFVFSISC